MFKNPGHKSTRFYNEILPGMYEKMYNALRTNFEKYFLEEREWRFDFHEFKETIANKIAIKTNPDDPNSCARYLKENFASTLSRDTERCAMALKDIDAILVSCQKKKQELDGLKDSLFSKEDNRLKRNMEEKLEYVIICIGDVDALVQKCEEIISALQATKGRLEKIGVYWHKSKGRSEEGKKNKSRNKSMKAKQQRRSSRKNAIIDKLQDAIKDGKVEEYCQVFFERSPHKA